MAGLIGIGRSESGHALQGLGQAAQMEEGRYRANQTLEANAKAAHAANVGSMTGTGAAIGLAAGTSGATEGAQAGSALGPWGALIGAAAGFLAGELFG